MGRMRGESLARNLLHCSRTLPRRGLHSASAVPKRVTIYEVGARDGLQNEPTILTPAERTVFVDLLSRTGVSKVEAASFVHPKLVPQMADGAEIMAGIQQVDGVAYPVLVPNLRGFSDAVAAGARTVAVMTAASETFSQQNTQSSMKQQLERATAVVAAATQRGIPARGYISCALGCPFEGSVAPSAVAPLARALHEAGCYEVVISDTIGTGTAGSMADVLRAVLVDVPVESVAVHCHDTYGQALANILVALQVRPPPFPCDRSPVRPPCMRTSLTFHTVLRHATARGGDG